MIITTECAKSRENLVELLFFTLPFLYIDFYFSIYNVLRWVQV